MSDLDSRLAAELRQAADQAAERVRPMDVPGITDRARRGHRRRRLLTVAAGAGGLTAAVSLAVTLLAGGGEPEPVPPAVPASVPASTSTPTAVPTSGPAPAPSRSLSVSRPPATTAFREPGQDPTGAPASPRGDAGVSISVTTSMGLDLVAATPRSSGRPS
ncbi:hypothetical protein, partial [Streptomyces sp. NPDC001985]|uniref:hypothetical protein n=1 Tax=Streptomyces sp. NPDC001985 TaxID=3154406 RepID=UPI0033182B6B